MYGFYIFCVQQMLGNISLVAFIMTRKSQPYGFTMWIKEMKNVLTEIIHVCKSAHGLPVIFKVFSHVKSFFCACLDCFTLHIKLFVGFFCPPPPPCADLHPAFCSDRLQTEQTARDCNKYTQQKSKEKNTAASLTTAR